MIELKNVYKTYKSKKSKNTKALDGVSVSFDDKGMTFILGKSGSGKSTLLNVLGGLDKYDDGDMLILGKSSKDFTQADFDSYRNTYVGFIFQEFNILEDYDVYENIILALQLQQKEINKSEIDELLDRLELTDLKKRKVNELSGGQKQRVAIARALIKNPKIILADEPTGNLDSKTGSQVMELLKEIAKEKLVVVVSHDEEYAEKYGDRIIEIKDGKIVNDSKEVKENNNLKNTYKTIKSHLPFKESFKLGIGSLKHKKIKLLFTIILIVATLGFLSCTDTLSSYNFSVAHSKLLAEKNEQFIQIEKKHIFNNDKDDSYIKSMIIPIDDDSIKKIQSQVNKENYDVYRYNDAYSGGRISELLRIKDDSMYYYNSNGIELVVTSDISKILKESIIGRNATSDNEIVISNYVANLMIQKGVEVHETVTSNEFKKSNIFEPKTYEDILNTNYNYYFGSSEKVKIVGIINYDLSAVTNDYTSNVLNKIFVNENFITNRRTEKLSSLSSFYETEIVVEGLTQDSDDGMMNGNNSIAGLDHQIEYFDGTNWKTTSSLKENEVILSIYMLNCNDNSYYEDLNSYTSNNNSFYMNYEDLTKRFIANYIKEKNVIGKKVDLKINYSNYDSKDLVQDYNNLTVIGVYYEDNNCNDNSTCYYSTDASYFSSTIVEKYQQKKVEKFSILYPMTDKSDFKKISNLFPMESELTIKSTYSEKMYSEKLVFDSLQKIAFYIGIVFLIFTIFLIINFMFNSISYRKKEIGVLRALGSRSRDVMKIFLWEGVCLALISGTIASILLVIVSNIMNSFVMSYLSGLLTTPFIVGIRQFVVIYLLVFNVTMISSILPILKISKMKPIDAILNK